MLAVRRKRNCYGGIDRSRFLGGDGGDDGERGERGEWSGGSGGSGKLNDPGEVDPINPRFCGDLMAIARHYAPVVNFHSQEAYFPSTVEWYLAQTTMRMTTYPSFNESVDAANVGTQTGFGSTSGDYHNNFYLDSSIESQSGQELGDAKVYVHFENVVSGYLDIQYWFFYPYNGPSWIKVKIGWEQIGHGRA